jgi:hypothetical protein
MWMDWKVDFNQRLFISDLIELFILFYSVIHIIFNLNCYSISRKNKSQVQQSKNLFWNTI